MSSINLSTPISPPTSPRDIPSNKPALKINTNLPSSSYDVAISESSRQLTAHNSITDNSIENVDVAKVKVANDIDTSKLDFGTATLSSVSSLTNSLSVVSGISSASSSLSLSAEWLSDRGIQTDSEINVNSPASYNPNTFLYNKSISCEDIIKVTKDASLLDTVSMYRSNSGGIATTSDPYALSLPSPLPSPSPSPRLSKSISSSSIGSCDSDGCLDDEGKMNIGDHVSIFNDYGGECTCTDLNSVSHSGCRKRKNTGGKLASSTGDLTMGGKILCPNDRKDDKTKAVTGSNSADNLVCEGGCFMESEDLTLFSVDGVTKLKGGSVERLVQRLGCDKHNDPDYTASFLLMYRYRAQAFFRYHLPLPQNFYRCF